MRFGDDVYSSASSTRTSLACVFLAHYKSSKLFCNKSTSFALLCCPPRRSLQAGAAQQMTSTKSPPLLQPSIIGNTPKHCWRWLSAVAALLDVDSCSLLFTSVGEAQINIILAALPRRGDRMARLTCHNEPQCRAERFLAFINALSCVFVFEFRLCCG